MKLKEKQEKMKELGYKGWLLTATQREINNCICSELDGKGVSVCGFPCPIHSKKFSSHMGED